MSNSWEKVFERIKSLEKRVAELEKAVQPGKRKVTISIDGNEIATVLI